LDELIEMSENELIEDRYHKFRKIGHYRMAEAEAGQAIE